MENINFQKLYYEPISSAFKRGEFLLNKYSNIPQIQIETHNNIPELRAYLNKDFPKLKKYLVIGTRKTHKYVPNSKISNFLVPFTSSGCYAMCQYCYLVCNYNKCSYLRVFVNKENILDTLIKRSNLNSKNTIYEIGSNSDLILENLVTEDLEENLNYFFDNSPNGILTFPTKFKNIEPLINIKQKNRLIPRISLNPNEIINKFELGTSNLLERIESINKLCECGYNTYILLAPIILTKDYKNQYLSLIETMSNKLSKKVKKHINFEIIFMTYSYVHDKINTEAFPNSPKLYSKDLMSNSRMGKYHYKTNLKSEATNFITELLKIYFENYKINYIV